MKKRMSKMIKITLFTGLIGSGIANARVGSAFSIIGENHDYKGSKSEVSFRPILSIGYQGTERTYLSPQSDLDKVCEKALKDDFSNLVNKKISYSSHSVGSTIVDVNDYEVIKNGAVLSYTYSSTSAGGWLKRCFTVYSFDDSVKSECYTPGNRMEYIDSITCKIED